VEGSEDGPVDDDSVDDETLLYRWVHPDFVRAAENGYEARDGAFKNFPNPELLRMSVAIEDRLNELKREPESILDSKPSGYGLVSLTARQVREEEQRIERSPTDEELAHGDVWGKKTEGRRRRFARMSQWVAGPS